MMSERDQAHEAQRAKQDLLADLAGGVSADLDELTRLLCADLKDPEKREKAKLSEIAQALKAVQTVKTIREGVSATGRPLTVEELIERMEQEV